MNDNADSMPQHLQKPTDPDFSPGHFLHKSRQVTTNSPTQRTLHNATNAYALPVYLGKVYCNIFVTQQHCWHKATSLL